MRAWAVVVVVGLGAPALAQTGISEEVRREAKAHFQRGKLAFVAGRYDEAVSEYLAAYEKVSFAELIFDVAEAYRKKPDRDKALEYYRKYLVLDPRGRGSDEARAQIAALAPMRDRPVRPAPSSGLRTPDWNAPAKSSGAGAAAPETVAPPVPPTPAAATPAPSATVAPALANALPAPIVLAAPPPAARRPLIKRPWFWITVGGGAALVAAGVSLAVIFGGPTRAPVPAYGAVNAN